MLGFMSNYFGPLSKDSCVYFLFLSIIFFFIMVFTIIGELVFLFKNYKRLDFKVFVSGIILLYNAFISYFSNRLLHTMCVENYIK